MNPSIFIKTLKKNFSKSKKGFTLAETIASMIALGVVAMSAQSLIVVSNRFVAAQDRSLSSLQSQNLIHNMICSTMSNPVSVQIDRTKTYHLTSSGSYEKLLKSSVSTKETRPATFAYHNENGALSDAKSGTLVHTAATSTPVSYASTSLPEVKLYKIYADSHTLISYTPSNEVLDYSSLQLGAIKEDSGVIIASRCIGTAGFRIDTAYRFINSELGSAIDTSEATTTDHEATLLYILENPYRPFVFKDGNKFFLKCHKVTESSSDVITNERDSGQDNQIDIHQYTPVTYFIKFQGADVLDKNAAGISKITQAFADVNLNGDSKDSLTEFCVPPSGGTPTAAQSDYTIDLNRIADDPLAPTALDKQAAEQECLKKHYYPTLLQEFSIPISNNNLHITELPIIKSVSQDMWATLFMAYTFPDQEVNFQLHMVDIINRCQSQGNPSGWCPTYPPLAPLASEVPNRAFRRTTKSCPFRYAKNQETASYVPMGLTHGVVED